MERQATALCYALCSVMLLMCARYAPTLAMGPGTQDPGSADGLLTARFVNLDLLLGLWIEAREFTAHFGRRYLDQGVTLALALLRPS